MGAKGADTVENSILFYEDVCRLLRDAGCSDEFTQRFLAEMETDSINNLLCLLRDQRSYQLGRLHEEEMKLDQLDYLRYELEKQFPTEAKTSRRRR